MPRLFPFALLSSMPWVAQHAPSLVAAAKRHPKPADRTLPFEYGTAGFRMKAAELDSVMFRVGVLAALRSLAQGGRTVGVMITASHNPIEDNGVKVVDPNGEMLVPEWEALAVRLANADYDTLEEVVEAIVVAQKLNVNGATSASVCVGYDTRPSSIPLSVSVFEGIKAAYDDVTTTDHGEVTTPELHYLVLQANDPAQQQAQQQKIKYVDQLAGAFRKLIGDRKQTTEVIVDAANGVGAPKAATLAEKLADVLPIRVINDGRSDDDVLNKDCGADYVKVQQAPSKRALAQPRVRFAALDGDADRLIYFSFKDDGAFYMLDGDFIAVLYADFIIKLAKKANLPSIQVGVVQTAYANGGSTAYLEKTLAVPVKCAKTGVKNLHHDAKEFDIGVYFEANGHGTVLFSERATKLIAEAAATGDNVAASQLLSVSQLINQVVGDALGDMLLVEAILLCSDLNIEEWSELYKDLPNRLAKVVVRDRRIFETTDAERKLTSPAGLQGKIDDLVKTYPLARSFVRPSGTEDVVRVYAEAATQQATDDLSKAVCRLVYDEAGGVGSRP